MRACWRAVACGLVLAALSGCYTLPSAEEQGAARAREGFSPGYRMAVSSMQGKLEPKGYEFGSGLLPTLVRELDQAIAGARIDARGGAPMDRLDETLREFAGRALGVDASILPRASYGANDSLRGNGGVIPRDAVDAAARQGYDGLLLLTVTPDLEPKGLSGSSGFRLALDARTVLRSIARDRLLHNEIETVACNETAGTDGEVVLLEGAEIPTALSDCYDALIARLPETLERQLGD